MMELYGDGGWQDSSAWLQKKKPREKEKLAVTHLHFAHSI